MKRLDCGQVIPGCDKTFEAPDEDGIMRQMLVHAREAHGMDELPPEVTERAVVAIAGTSEGDLPAPAG